MSVHRPRWEEPAGPVAGPRLALEHIPCCWILVSAAVGGTTGLKYGVALIALAAFGKSLASIQRR